MSKSGNRPTTSHKGDGVKTSETLSLNKPKSEDKTGLDTVGIVTDKSMANSSKPINPDRGSSDTQKETSLEEENNSTPTKTIKSDNEQVNEPIKTLKEFLERFLVRKGKLLKDDKTKFDSLDSSLDEESAARLSQQFHKQDKDLKYCLTLCDFLLEGSTESSCRKQLLNFIERVVGEYSHLSNIKSNTIFQLWLDKSDDNRDKLEFFENNFTRLKGTDGKQFTPNQLGTLLCISAVWLYFKKESDFTTLTRYLSRSAFSTEGRSSNLIEPQAFAFATSMISSTKKKGFAYFLQKVSETESSLSQQLKVKAAESNQKSTQIFKLNQEIKNLTDKSVFLEAEKESLTSQVKQLEQGIKAHEEKARHRHTHHEDSKDELRIKLKNVLEGELKDVLEKAKKAHSKGKHEVVEYQIDDALDILVRELERVK